MHAKRRWCAVSEWLDHCRRSVIADVITLWGVQLTKDSKFLAEHFTGARRWILISELAIFSLLICSLAIWQGSELAFFAVPLRFASLFFPFSLAVVRCSLVTKLSLTILAHACCCRAFLCIQLTGSPEFIFVYMGVQCVLACIALLILHRFISRMPLAFFPGDLIGFIAAAGLSYLTCREYFDSFSTGDAWAIAAYGSVFGVYGVSIIFTVLCCYLGAVTKSGKIASVVFLLLSGSLFVNEFWYTDGTGLMTLAYGTGSLMLLFPFLRFSIPPDAKLLVDDLANANSNAQDLNPYRPPIARP